MRAMRARTTIVAFCVLSVQVLVAGACGGGSDAGSAVVAAQASAADGVAATPPGTVVAIYDGEVRTVTAAVVDLHGERAGLISVLSALERGYDFGQIRAGAENASLGLDGRIAASAEEVAPHDRRAGVVQLADDPDEGEGASAVAGDKPTIEPVANRRSARVTSATHRRQVPAELVDALANSLAPIDVQLRDLNNDPLTEQVPQGDALIAAILSLGRSGYTLDQIVEVFLFADSGVQVIDGGCAVISPVGTVRPQGSFDSECAGRVRSVVDDAENAEAGSAPVASDQTGDAPVAVDDSSAVPMKVEWVGDMLPTAEFVRDPVTPGSIVMTRSAGTDQFGIEVITATLKTGTFTTDGFNEVECTARWTQTFVGTGTFWHIDTTRIEFAGEMTLEIVYTAGPCDETPEPTTNPFSGVQAIVTPDGIRGELSGWSFEIAGPPPMPA